MRGVKTRMQARRGRGVSTAAIVLLVVVVAAAFVIAIYALAPFGTSQTTGAIQTVLIRIPNGAGANDSITFTPQTVTVVVDVNNTIQWKNFDTVSHTVTSTSVPKGATSFGSTSNLVGPGQLYTITLNVPGVYEYHCAIHSHMVGTIIVKSG